VRYEEVFLPAVSGHAYQIRMSQRVLPHQRWVPGGDRQGHPLLISCICSFHTAS